MISQKLTYIADTVAHLIEQFKDRPNLAEFLTSWANEFQELENAFWELMTERDLVNAVGEQLDGLGQILGKAREGLNDTDYRARLNIQVLINNSNGTRPELVVILDLFLSETYTITEHFPAAYIVDVEETLTENLNELLQILSKTKPAGVRGQLHYQLVEDAYVFTLSSTDVAQTSSDQGLADDPGANGGEFRDAEEF